MSDVSDVFAAFSADFQENYNARGCQSADNMTLRSSSAGESATVGYPGGGGEETDMAGTTSATDGVMSECLRETSLLYLLLMLGTAWLGLSLYNFTKTYVIIVVDVYAVLNVHRRTLLVLLYDTSLINTRLKTQKLGRPLYSNHEA